MPLPPSPEAEAEAVRVARADEETRGRAANLARVRRRLRERGLAGAVAVTDAEVRYLAGFAGMVSGSWPLHGTVLAFVGAEDDEPVTLVVGDLEARPAAALRPAVEVVTYPMWAELGGLAAISRPARPGASRPAQYRPADLDRAVAGVLEARGWGRARLGVTRAQVKVSTWERLHRGAPGAEWADFGPDLYAVRSVKAPFEVAALRAAVEVAEAAVAGAVADLAEGTSAARVRQRFLGAAARHAEGDPRFDGFTGAWVLPGIGGEPRAGAAGSGPGLRVGQVLKLDGGATVDGYQSDLARSFSFGAEPSADTARLYGTFRAALERAVAAIRPGVTARSVFRVASDHIRDHGFPGYVRGHLGHSVGLDAFVEEPPFVSEEDATVLTPGMVVAVETPFYGGDVGGFNIEDLVLVTETGGESLMSLDRGLVRV